MLTVARQKKIVVRLGFVQFKHYTKNVLVRCKFKITKLFHRFVFAGFDMRCASLVFDMTEFRQTHQY